MGFELPSLEKDLSVLFSLQDKECSTRFPQRKVKEIANFCGKKKPNYSDLSVLFLGSWSIDCCSADI